MNDFQLSGLFHSIDRRISDWMARNGITLLRLSLGLIFFWFGILKFFPGMSPAQNLSSATIERLTFGLIQPDISVPLLAAWESLIGIGLLFNMFIRTIILLLLVQMAGTLTPLFLFPNLCFNSIPFAPTIEGQYIIKNLVLISGAIVIGATVRGGGLVSSRIAERERR